jgi:hypothetical protein
VADLLTIRSRAKRLTVSTMTWRVFRDVGQHGREARAGLDRVGAGDGRVIELADDPVPVGSANASIACLWRLSLSFSAPTLPAPEVLRWATSASVFPFRPLT